MRRSARLLCTSSVSAVRLSLRLSVCPDLASSKTLDCNLHRSLWSSCVDVPVLESEPRSGGWGRGGRGASCGLHFLCGENPACVSQEWKGIESLLFPFCPSGNCSQKGIQSVCFLELLSFSGSKYPQTCCGFIHLNSPCVKEQI